MPPSLSVEARDDDALRSAQHAGTSHQASAAFSAIAPRINSHCHYRARTQAHAAAAFFVAPALKPCLVFGASASMCVAARRDAQSQSGRLSFDSPLANQQHQSATGHRLMGRPSYGGQRVETALPRPMSIRQNLWKSNQGSKAMPRPSIITNAQKACLFSSALASVPSLTERSSGHQQGPRLRHCLGPCWCPSHLRCSGAAYLGR